MSQKKSPKPYWEMTPQALADATKQFDKEFVADTAKPLSRQMRQKWARAKTKLPRAHNGLAAKTIAVHLEETLLDQCTALAKKKRISRDALIARSLKALLAVESQR
jgi:hypothetical protein